MLTKISKRSKGFTLVELLVTIAILAVLATVSVVGYTSFIEKSAVSTDNYLVTQLNDLTRLYEIEHTGNFEKSEIRKLLKDAGITSLELKSESYDYRLYFNQNNNKFILTTEDYLNDEKYLLIDDGFLSKNDGDGVGGDNKNDEENNPGEVTPPAGGDQEPGEGEPTVPDTPEVIEPNLVLQDFEESFANNRYIKASDGIIDIGISIDEDQFTRKTELDLSKIIIIESNTKTICDIRSYSIDDVEFDSSIVFDTLGKKILKVCVEYNEIEIIVEIPVKVWNAFFSDSIINISNTVLHNLTPSKNDDGSYNIDIRIENFTSISIIETEQSTSQLSSRTINDNPSFLDNMKLIIVLNDVFHDATIEFDNSLVFTFENVVVESSMLNCDIFYYYQGINGNWCEATVEIAKELK